MNKEELKDAIINIAGDCGIDIVGITTAEDFNDEKERVNNRIISGNLSSFVKNVDNLISPKKIWDEAKSIISIGVSYNSNITKSARISRVAWGEDYHRVLINKMESLMTEIQNKFPHINYKAYVDNAPLLDRAVAYRSGIGFYGKNNFIINPKYGSYIFLGHILINEKVDTLIVPLQNTCGQCSRCIESCPTNALGNFQLNPERCISYLTQKKQFLKRWERKAIGHHIYGCDICQNVCPFNKKNIYSSHDEFRSSKMLVNPPLSFIINMSNEDFTKTYKHTSAGWRGKKLLQRNALIVAGNLKNDVNKELLENSINDERWDIRIYSMFSLMEYGDDGIGIVKDRMTLENEDFRRKFHEYKD